MQRHAPPPPRPRHADEDDVEALVAAECLLLASQGAARRQFAKIVLEGDGDELAFLGEHLRLSAA
jgi:hypothetical protein